MSHQFRGPRSAAVLLGCAGALILLVLTTRRGMAEKASADDCLNHKDSICRTVETCKPKGFEENGTCRWDYTIARSYWKY